MEDFCTKEIIYQWDFPSGLMAKTLCCQCRGAGFSPWSGTRSQMPQQPRIPMLPATMKVKDPKFGQTMNKAAINTHMQGFVWTYSFSPLGKYQGAQLPD